MAQKITATEAVRKFSELLSSIKYQGERYTIVRGGKPVASILPAAEQTRGKTLGDLKRLLAEIPRLGDDANAFEADVRAAREAQPLLPEKN